MPKASEHTSSAIQKLLYMGDSGTGKTTSCAPLAREYKLRIYDFDNLLFPLIAVCRKEGTLGNVEYMTFRDNMRASAAGPICDGLPQAFVNGLKAFDEWEDGTKPKDWGPDYIAIIDSHTTLSRAAYFWGRGMQGAAGMAEGVSMKGFDPRQAFYTAQQAIMNVVALLTSESFYCNVIDIAHIKYLEHDNAIKGFPLSIGSAISPEIPTYFPTVALATKNGTRRVIRTRSTNMIDLKNPRAFEQEFAEELSMDTGLVEYFKASRK